jgi:hypothetical protein
VKDGLKLNPRDDLLLVISRDCKAEAAKEAKDNASLPPHDINMSSAPTVPLQSPAAEDVQVITSTAELQRHQHASAMTIEAHIERDGTGRSVNWAKAGELYEAAGKLGSAEGEEFLRNSPPDDPKVPDALYWLSCLAAEIPNVELGLEYVHRAEAAEAPNVRLPCFPAVDDNVPPKTFLRDLLNNGRRQTFDLTTVFRAFLLLHSAPACSVYKYRQAKFQCSCKAIFSSWLANVTTGIVFQGDASKTPPRLLSKVPVPDPYRGTKGGLRVVLWHRLMLMYGTSLSHDRDEQCSFQFLNVPTCDEGNSGAELKQRSTTKRMKSKSMGGR